MKTTTAKFNDKSRHLIRTGAMVALTILLLSGGTAYANHNRHGYNSGLSVSLGYVYYPKVQLHQDVYRYPRHGHHTHNNYYRSNYGHHKPWRNKHARKHHGKHRGRHYDY